MLARRSLLSSSRVILHHAKNRRFNSTATVTKEQDAPDGSSTTTEDVHIAESETSDSPTKKGKMERTTHHPVNPWARNLLENTKVEEFLSSLSDQATVTIADVERHRPKKHSTPGTPQYEDEYNKLVAALCQSFSKKQLRHIGKLYNLDPRLIRTKELKPAYAAAIIEHQWQWPSIVEVRKQHLLWSTYTEKSFHVTPSEMFFVIGKDGSDLLALAGRHRVHVSLSSNPLQLKVEGIQGELDKLIPEIDKMKMYVFDETFSLPLSKSLPQTLVQRVSRLSNAYIHNLETPGRIRIYAKEPISLVTAKRLANRAILQIEERPDPLLWYKPAFGHSEERLFPPSYSLYPFTPSRPAPWTTGNSKLYRPRRVGEWLDVGCTENISQTGGLAGGNGHITTIDDKDADIRQLLASKLGAKSRVKASFGHVLTQSTNAQRGIIAPPMRGSWPLQKVVQFLRTHPSAPIFLPSLPSMFLESKPEIQRVLHRLEYRTIPRAEQAEEKQRRKIASTAAMSLDANPSTVIRWESVLHEAQGPALAAESALDKDYTVSKDQDEMLVSAAAGKQALESALETAVEANKSSSAGMLPSMLSSVPEEDTNLPHRCLAGLEASVNVMLADRPMDLRFTAFDGQSLAAADEPTQLQEYLASLRAFLSYQVSENVQPAPPLSFHLHGEEYFLYSNVSVRQNIEALPTWLQDDKSLATLKVFSESVLDLESTQKSTFAELICDGEDDDSWKTFLKGCDFFTSRSHRLAHNQG